MTREIIGFLGGPKGARVNLEAPEVFEKAGGKHYVISILKGSIDKETRKIIAEDVHAISLEENLLKEVEIGMFIDVNE